MNRKDKHINKFLHDQLPDPEIPADDAWAGMSDMLNASQGHGASSQGQLSKVLKAMSRFKGLLIGASAVLTSTAVALIVLNAETKTSKITESKTINIETSDSALVKSDIKTPASNAGNEEITTTNAGAEVMPSQTTTPATTSPETAPSKTADTPGAIAPASRGSADIATKNSVISENRRVQVKRRLSATSPIGSSRVRTGTAQARVLRTHDARTSAGTLDAHGQEESLGHIASANKNEKGSFPCSPTHQSRLGLPAKGLSSEEPPQETVSSFSLEKNTPAAPSATSLRSLTPVSGDFKIMKNDLSKLIKRPSLSNTPQPRIKTRASIWQNMHFGPEWSINRSFAPTDYLFTGADSVKHPARVAIPGLFVSKNWGRHTVTFIFNPLHSYFGDKERLAQRVDTIPGPDSTSLKVYHNTNFIKAFGVNFSLQYQFQATSWLSLVGGTSYARYSAALLRKETEYHTGTIIPEAHLTAKGQEALKSYIQPQQWNIRAGILLHSPKVLNNRLQVAWTTIIPISNLSLNGFKSVKSPNVQVSLRFLVK